MKIVVTSDTHGLHDAIDIPDGDIFIHAGDFSGHGDLNAVTEFSDFLAQLPHPYKIVIAGNHDVCFEKQNEKARDCLRNCIYLQDESVTIEGIKFYGTPWQPFYCYWAFNLKRGQALREKWALIPADTDVLITHGPPMGHGDEVYPGEHVGCEDLLERVHSIGPRYHLFGHIHEGHGITHDRKTTFINASALDSYCRPKHPALSLEYEATVLKRPLEKPIAAEKFRAKYE